MTRPHPGPQERGQGGPAQGRARAGPAPPARGRHSIPVRSFRRLHLSQGVRPLFCFNLLRRYAVISTSEKIRLAKPTPRFQSPTEICSHSDVSVVSGAVVRMSFNLLRRYAVIPTSARRSARRVPPGFQSPTEICSHSDSFRRIGRLRYLRVSISYGDMQSFRLNSGKTLVGSMPCFNLLRRYAVIPTGRGKLQLQHMLPVSISYGDMQSFRPEPGTAGHGL